MLIKFGIWEVDEEYGLIGKVNPGYDYNISQDQLWHFHYFEGQPVWDMLIHLTEKTWITPENVNDLNTAFYFCHDLFKDTRPLTDPYISTAYTILLQRRIMEVQHQLNKLETAPNEEKALIEKELLVELSKLIYDSRLDEL